MGKLKSTYTAGDMVKWFILYVTVFTLENGGISKIIVLT